MSAATAVPAHRRHDISGQVWEILEPLLPGGKGKTGRPAYDNRLFLNAVFWILRTGAPWRDLPPDYGDWKKLDTRYLGLTPVTSRSIPTAPAPGAAIKPLPAQKGAQQ